MRKVFSHLLAGAALIVFSGGTLAFAQSPGPAPIAPPYENPITYGGIKTIPEFLLALVDLIFLIAVPIIVIFIIYSGFLFVTAGGNESQIERARRTFLWTVIGAGVLLGAKAIELAIQNTVCGLKGGDLSSYFCP